jgi:hypothetical protein
VGRSQGLLLDQNNNITFIWNTLSLFDSCTCLPQVDTHLPAKVDTHLPAQEDARLPAQEVDAQLPAQEVDARLPAQAVDLPAQEVDARLPAQEVDARLPAQEVDARLPAQEVDARLPAQAIIFDKLVWSQCRLFKSDWISIKWEKQALLDQHSIFSLLSINRSGRRLVKHSQFCVAM